MLEESNRPKDTDFSQQRLAAFKPVHTAKSSAIIFIVFSLVFFAFGIVFYVSCNTQKEYWERYDKLCEGQVGCKVQIKIDSVISDPVYVYYELTNFYQNHRLYVKSKSYTQLRGDSPSSTELDNCKYARYNKDFEGYYDSSKILNPDDTARPCGLIARSVFNDTIVVEGYDIKVNDIVSSADRYMYKSVDSGIEWTDMNEHFIVWMKISPLTRFRKLYGVIEGGMEKGNVYVDIKNNYDVSNWNGEKRVILATNGDFGGKSTVLGVVFIAAGIFSFVFSTVFTIVAVFKKETWLDQDPRDWKI